MIKDDWLCCSDVVKALVAGCPPEGTTTRISRYRDTAIEHFFFTSFALPQSDIARCLETCTHEEEMRLENRRNHIRLLQENNSRFLCRKFADHFGLHFSGGTCRDEDRNLIAHRYVETRSKDDYVEISVAHLADFLRSIDHVLLRYTSIVRYSERLRDEFDFSDVVPEARDDTYCATSRTGQNRLALFPAQRSERASFG